MTNNNNLYSEEMITESPFYYDQSGRLRVRVLSEESVKAEKKEEEMVVRTADFQDRDLDGTDDRDQPAPGPDKAPEPAKEVQIDRRQKKRNFLQRGKSVKGPGRNVNSREGLRNIDAALARGAELKKRGKEVLARSSELRSKLRAKRGEAGTAKLGEPMTPEQKVEKKNMKAEFRALKGEKKQMKASGEKPSAEMKLKLKDMKSKLKSMPKAGKMAGRLKNLRATNRLSMQESAPATDYLNEKINLKKAKMGDVIKDFQESDAPQFKGKSKAKRRIMAIAAKLQAERG